MPQTINTTELIQDSSPVEMPTGLEFRRNDTNRVLLREAQRAAGICLEWPVDTRTVFAVLGIMGYRADRSALDHCLGRNYFPRPSKHGGEFQWREADLIAFADALESLRRWQSMHPCHRHKLSPDELARHAVEAAQKQAALQAFAAMHPNELVNLLVECEQQDTRHLIAAALKDRLGMLNLKGTQPVPEHSSAETN